MSVFNMDNQCFEEYQPWMLWCPWYFFTNAQRVQAKEMK